MTVVASARAANITLCLEKHQQKTAVRLGKSFISKWKWKNDYSKGINNKILRHTYSLHFCCGNNNGIYITNKFVSFMRTPYKKGSLVIIL